MHIRSVAALRDLDHDGGIDDMSGVGNSVVTILIKHNLLCYWYSRTLRVIYH